MLVLFGANYLWSWLVTPLFGSLKPMMALMTDALLRSAVMLALALLALCRIHISDGIDTLLLKVHLLKKTKQKDL